MKLVVMLMLLVLTQSAQAAFVINSTRYIYNQDDNSIPVEVSNKSDRRYGGQISVYQDGAAKGEIDTDSAVVLPSPPVFKINPNAKQRVNLRMINKGTLPQDRETLFWLNILEIPLADGGSSTAGNSISLAMSVKLKLLYRPSSIAKARRDAESKVTYKRENGQLVLTNNTPFYFAVSKIMLDGNEINNISAEARGDLQKFVPFSSVNIALGKAKKFSEVQIKAIDDWGATNTFVLATN